MDLKNTKIDLTNDTQKGIAAGLVLLTLVALWWLLPPFIVIMKNLWIAAILAAPVVFIALNPMLIWNEYKRITWSLTKNLISKDKLGYMYRYHDYLLEKIKKLGESIKEVTAAHIGVARSISELDQKLKENKKLAVSYQALGKPDTVQRTLANKIAVDEKQLNSLLPRSLYIENQKNKLIQLSEIWAADAEDLKYTLDAKAEEYKLMKSLSSASNTASAYLTNNDEEFKIFKESLKQIEDTVVKYTANLEDFERRLQPQLSQSNATRASNEEEGFKLIEEFKKNSVQLKMA